MHFFAATGKDDVLFAHLDEFGSVADAVRAGGAGGADGVVHSFDLEGSGEAGGGGRCHGFGDGVGADAFDAARAQGVRCFDLCRGCGTACADDEAGADVGDVFGQEARLLNRFFHGDVAVGGGITHEAQDFAVDVRFGVDVDAAFDLGTQPHFDIHGVVFDAGFELLQRRQYFFAIVADTGDDAHAGDDDAFHVWGFSWLHG